MFGDFCESPQRPKFQHIANCMPNEHLVLYAEYELDGYEGRSVVVFLDREHGLMVNYSDHCSCYGLEWGPERTSINALLLSKNKTLSATIAQSKDKIKAYMSRSGLLP